MPLSLICACGARIELEDALAGQEIACPECQQPRKAPAGAGQSQPIRTSGFALASLILAVAGAFTIVGTLAAVVLGLIAVVLILRHRDQIAGLGYAIAGIAIGTVFTPLTIFAFTTTELFGVAGSLREHNMAAVLDRTGPLEVIDRGWAITRPNEQWGVTRSSRVNDPLVEVFLAKSTPDVLLAQARHNAFVDVLQQTDAGKNLDAFAKEYLDEYVADDDIFGAEPRGKEEGVMHISQGKVTRGPYSVAGPPGCTGREAELEVLAASQKWTMVVRIFHDPQTKTFYVLRAYTPRRSVKQNKDEFTKALDSFRLVK
jgi:hypothetical protein